MKKEHGKINRRDFLKIVEITTATATVSLYGCKPAGKDDPLPTRQMTYRTMPSSGDKVSLLGYGCIRCPLRKDVDK